MKFRALAMLAIPMTALAISNPTYSQTAKIRTSTLINGNPVYTEVFEYDYVDEKPEFPGGGRSLLCFINSTRQYPVEAYEMGVEGRVICAFIVNPDGKLSNFQVLRGVESSLNKEALRIVSLMPPWLPGKINKQPVPVRVVCCIPFRK